MEVKVEIVSKTIVKPSSPTPQHLKTYKFSIFDQLFYHVYVPLLFYYPNDEAELDPAEKSQKLKWSLSQVLTHFYPLAGRSKDNFSVQCTDEGVEFIETLIDCNLSDILKLPDPVLLRKLLPKNVELSTRCLLMVQANFFKEGSLVIGVCISHKIADVSTLSSFINAWAGLAAESREVEFPIFRASVMFPPLDNLATLSILKHPRSNCNVVTRRYVVNVAMIAALKSRAASESVPNPTSVEVVSALIWKCTTKAASRKHNHSMKLIPSVLHQAVNLRKRLHPPLPHSFFGNLASFFMARIEGIERGDLGLQTLVTRLREGKDSMIRHYIIDELSSEHGSIATCEAVADYSGLMMNNSLDFYRFTSWCKFPFYEADFGWGKPTWVSFANHDYNKNFVVLIDAPAANGIEAWITLDEPTMAIFERDEELLQFAIINPTIP